MPRIAEFIAISRLNLLFSSQIAVIMPISRLKSQSQLRTDVDMVNFRLKRASSPQTDEVLPYSRLKLPPPDSDGGKAPAAGIAELFSARKGAFPKSRLGRLR